MSSLYGAAGLLSPGLNTQLRLLIGVGLVLVTLASTILAWSAIRATAMQSAVEMATTKLQGDLNVLEDRVDRHFGELALQDRTLVDDGGADLAGRFEMLDELSRDLSIVATIFVSEGQDYRRLLTSIRDDAGERVIGTMLGTASAAYEPLRGGQDYFGRAAILGRNYVTGYRPLTTRAGETIGVLFVGVEVGAIQGIVESGARSALWRNLGISLLIFLGIQILSTLFIRRSIVSPLLDTIQAAGKLARGDLSARIDHSLTRRRDEIGTLAQALEAMIEKLQGIIGSVVSGSAQISSASKQTASTAQTLSQGASEQAASVEQTTASVEQMAASIQHNSESAAATDELSTQAAAKAVQGRASVRETVAAMNSIAERIRIIDDIAYQTNLLALNAAIEAARAGQHGKGFAVVAAEVRKLAERSQLASREIGEVANGSVEVADRAGRLLDQLEPLISQTSSLVREISAASVEQQTGARQISQAMEQLNAITEQSASASEQLASSSEELNGQARQLEDVVSFFSLSEQR
ncbi:MAG: methyl-accepting chemotaxis protein [Wenzhouxiangella sp.]